MVLYGRHESVSSKAIIGIAHRYFVNAPIQRIPERIQTLGTEVELETKVNIDKLDNVELILNNISELGFSKVSHRTEWHHFFSNDFIAHNVLILIQGSNEIWIKIKKDKHQIKSPHNNFPILLRHEKKMKPQDNNYRDEFQRTVCQNYIGSFQKECLDFSFWYKDASFTATLSLADSKQRSLHQIEFEFDGHKKNTEPPNFNTILNLFEQMLSNVCPSKINKFNTYTKLEWLLLSVKNESESSRSYSAKKRY